jgi:hypothetical protein
LDTAPSIHPNGLARFRFKHFLRSGCAFSRFTDALRVWTVGSRVSLELAEGGFDGQQALSVALEAFAAFAPPKMASPWR